MDHRQFLPAYQPVALPSVLDRSVMQYGARLGERVCLALVVKPGMQLDPVHLLRDLERCRAGEIQPAGIFSVGGAMPLTPSGKIIKRELMRWVAEGEVQPIPLRG